MEMESRFNTKLDELKATGNFRILPEQPDSALLNLSSNDYLGLSEDENLYHEFLDSLSKKRLSFTASSSRLLSGNSVEYGQLENLIASTYEKESCLLYNSGYHANVGIISALAGKNDLIVSDKFIHASLIDGVRLSKAQVMRYRHLDHDHLENILASHRDEYDQVFILSESIFSMDGDLADLEKLVELKQKFNCFLYLDEAHAVGAVGQMGLGLAETSGLISEIDFIVGTFGKALASVGAFVCCKKLFKDYLVNHSRTLIYTTALPPVNLAWSKFIFERLPDFQSLRKGLKNLSDQFARQLGQIPQSHIIPFIIGANEATIAQSKSLKANGFHVLPIRYPTVLQGTARLRFSLNAKMTKEQLQPIIKLLKENE
ncbi:MAG: 8-amino-7-oxononanoate synthase [Flammeovirgaceae bacterium]|nr:8-amino-7-oxononanoate synthase [Flammeovirgaceae bacterium]